MSRKHIFIVLVLGTNAILTCPKECPHDFSPICGQDIRGYKQTFSNMCFFVKRQCHKPEEGNFIYMMQSLRQNYKI